MTIYEVIRRSACYAITRIRENAHIRECVAMRRLTGENTRGFERFLSEMTEIVMGEILDMTCAALGN
jgi:hypothetical protein